MSDAFDPLIWETAARHGVDPRLVKAVVAAESSFQPRAYRAEPHIGDASYGLMQTLFRTAKDMGYAGSPEGLYDPGTSLEFGTRYLAYQLRRYGGRVPYAIAAYNAGTAFVAPNGAFRNQTYVDRVLRFYARFGGNGKEGEAGVRSDSPQRGPASSSTPIRLQAISGANGARGASIETFVNEKTAPWLIAVGGAILLTVLSGRRD